MTAIDEDDEFTAMQSVFRALSPLKDDARQRVIKYIIARFDIKAAASQGKTTDSSDDAEQDQGSNERQTDGSPYYNTFAELFADAAPKTSADKALVAGYWLQVQEGAKDFDAYSANNILKNLGEKVSNITVAMDNLKSQKPQLALQLRKSGSSQQARKTYMLTVAGTRAVLKMMEENKNQQA